MRLALLLLFAAGLQIVFAQEQAALLPRPIFPDDPKGLELPRAIPRMVDTNGNVVWIDEDFTTPEYQRAAFDLVLKEANNVAMEIGLPENLPIAETNLVEAVVTPFGFNFIHKTIGNVTTKNYCYYVSKGYKFCYLEGTHQAEECSRFESEFTWPVSHLNTNQAYSMATNWLSAVSMDVNAMNRDCNVSVVPDDVYVHPPPGKFVPIYDVYWTRKGYVKENDVASMLRSGVASVRLFIPTKALLQLRVEDPKYILRKPLVLTNLDALLPGTALPIKMPPAQQGLQPGQDSFWRTAYPATDCGTM